MTKREAQRLSRKIERHDPRCHVSTLRHYNRNYSLDVVDTRTGIPFVVLDAEDWEERVKTSTEPIV